MELIADILLISGALGAGFYCVVLSRRLTRFTDLEKGVGGAVAVLSAQVDDMTRTLKSAQAAASGSGAALATLTDRADGVARRLELMVASMHDLPAVDLAASDEVDAQDAGKPAAASNQDAPAARTGGALAAPEAADSPNSPGNEMPSPQDLNVASEGPPAPKAPAVASGGGVVAQFRSRRSVEAAE